MLRTECQYKRKRQNLGTQTKRSSKNTNTRIALPVLRCGWPTRDKTRLLTRDVFSFLSSGTVRASGSCSDAAQRASSPLTIDPSAHVSLLDAQHVLPMGSQWTMVGVSTVTHFTTHTSVKPVSEISSSNTHFWLSEFELRGYILVIWTLRASLSKAL